ncbi:MAG TPA: hypothetical protein VKX16_17615 [Chloroflexota bacterium]|nr:hypothetical protein [Chloroflexota bacterium]
MDVLDQFVPTETEVTDEQSSGDGEWAAEFHSEESSFGTGASVTSPFDNPTPSFGAAPQGDSIARARQLSQQLATTLTELSVSLDGSESERQSMLAERSQMEEFIAELQTHRAEKDRFTEAVKNGQAGVISDDDLTTIQGMMETLTQDPDRLTVLFTVVQQAGKLSAIVRDYTDLRHIVAEK